MQCTIVPQLVHTPCSKSICRLAVLADVVATAANHVRLLLAGLVLHNGCSTSAAFGKSTGTHHSLCPCVAYAWDGSCSCAERKMPLPARHEYSFERMRKLLRWQSSRLRVDLLPSCEYIPCTWHFKLLGILVVTPPEVGRQARHYNQHKRFCLAVLC
jgi:hypothetical protein